MGSMKEISTEFDRIDKRLDDLDLICSTLTSIVSELIKERREQRERDDKILHTP